MMLLQVVGWTFINVGHHYILKKRLEGVGTILSVWLMKNNSFQLFDKSKLLKQ